MSQDAAHTPKAAQPPAPPVTPPTGGGPESQRGQSLGRASALMASGTMVSRVLGMVRAALLVVVIGGTGLSADAFSVANTLPNQINLLVAGGMLGAVLVPQIVKAAGRPDGGEDYVNRLLTLSLIVMALTTAVGLAAAPLLVGLFSNAKDPAAIRLAVTFAYLCLPQIFFYGLYTLLGNVLNARGRFTAFMWAPVLANVVSIIGLLIFTFSGYPRQAAPGDWSSGMIWLLAGTMTLSIVVQAIFLVIPLRRSGFRYRPRFGFRGAGLRSASGVALWSFAAVAVGQLGFIVTSRVLTRASDLAERDRIVAAGKASYDNAFLLFMLPHSLITVSLTTALFVRLATAAQHGNTRAVVADLNRGLRMPAPLTVPISLAGVLFAPLVVKLFFQQDQGTTDAIAGVLVAMLLGVLPFGWLYLINRVYYAFEDGRTPFYFQVLVTAVATGFNLYAFTVPVTQTGIWVGIGQTVSNAVGALLGFLALRRKLGLLGLSRTIRMHVRLVLASAVALALGWLALAWIPASWTDSVLGAAAVLLVLGPAYLVLAWGLGHLMRVREVDDLLAPVTRRLPRVGTPRNE